MSGLCLITPVANSPVAYFAQNPWIKNGTIYENLIALAPTATKLEMLQVLDQLGLANELEHKHSGLNTIIGQHGAGLSGGQLQRIAFARLLLNPKPIVLLDEPTAKLDLLSKEFIVDTLKAIQPNVIMVIASHDSILIRMATHHINLCDTNGE